MQPGNGTMQVEYMQEACSFVRRRLCHSESSRRRSSLRGLTVHKVLSYFLAPQFPLLLCGARGQSCL